MTNPTIATTPSPCISLCKMNPDSDLCEGCWRTLNEIIAWGTASEETKREIWHNIQIRKYQSSTDSST